ncbi:hypothetical protein LTR17_003851 [Elasticomyces elasticus]|nr:hypothetical protein LTR17_003851 [Elasticomyces elasticus]
MATYWIYGARRGGHGTYGKDAAAQTYLQLLTEARSLALLFCIGLGVSTLALYVSYLIPITLLVLKRLRGEKVAFGPFSVGKFGLWIKIYALVLGVFIVIFLPFPVATPVDATTMNYAGPVFLGLVILAPIDWVLRGRHYYTGPTREENVGLEQTDNDPDLVLRDEHTKQG